MDEIYKSRVRNRIKSAARRAQACGIDPLTTISTNLLLKCWEEWGIDPDLCINCGQSAFRFIPAIPYNQGGQFDINNLVPVCVRCQNHHRPMQEWIAVMRERLLSKGFGNGIKI